MANLKNKGGQSPKASKGEVNKQGGGGGGFLSKMNMNSTKNVIIGGMRKMPARAGSSFGVRDPTPTHKASKKEH